MAMCLEPEPSSFVCWFYIPFKRDSYIKNILGRLWVDGRGGGTDCRPRIPPCIVVARTVGQNLLVGLCGWVGAACLLRGGRNTCGEGIPGACLFFVFHSVKGILLELVPLTLVQHDSCEKVAAGEGTPHPSRGNRGAVAGCRGLPRGVQRHTIASPK